VTSTVVHPLGLLFLSKLRSVFEIQAKLNWPNGLTECLVGLQRRFKSHRCRNNDNNNNKHAYASATECLRVILVLTDSGYGGGLRCDSSFGTNRENDHRFNRTIWLYALWTPHVQCEQGSSSQDCNRLRCCARSQEGEWVGLQIPNHPRDKKYAEASEIIIIWNYDKEVVVW